MDAYERITDEPFSRLAREGRGLRARVLIRPKEGILDPQGQTVERALPALGFEGVSDVHVGRLVELDVRGRLPQRPEMCEQLLANPLIEDYEILVVERREVRRRSLPRLLRRGRRPARLPPLRATRSCSGTATATCAASTRRGARRLLLRRLPARRRDRPLLAGDGGGASSSRRDGGPVLGICNGFQVLCEAGLLPGRAAAERSACASSAARSTSWSRTRDTPFTRACEQGELLSMPGQAHDRPLLRARGRLDELEADGQVRAALRARARTRTARPGRHRRRVQRGTAT